jgi:hypothetical protein
MKTHPQSTFTETLTDSNVEPLNKTESAKTAEPAGTEQFQMSRTRITDKYEISIDHSLGECMGYDSGCWIFEVNSEGLATSPSIPLILDGDTLRPFWEVVSWGEISSGKNTDTAKQYSIDAINQLSDKAKQEVRDALKVDLIRRRFMSTTSDDK